jgi:hypothetical protein
MRSWKLLVALVGVAVVGAAGVVVLWPRPPSRITREKLRPHPGRRALGGGLGYV